MAFNKNIPQPGDRLSQSQQDLLNNNLQLNTSMGVNHYPFDDLTANNGMHKFCQLVEQGVDPVPGSGTDSLYTKVAGSPALGELFYVRGNAGTPIQMTNGNIKNGNQGYSFLPGGVLIQWGTQNISAGSTVNFNTPFSAAPFIIQLSIKATQTSSSRIALSVVSDSAFDKFIYSLTQVNVSSSYIYWLAIGPGSGA